MADDSNAPDSAEKELFGDSAPAATQSAPAVTPDIDAVVRTAYAEANKGGYGAVAGVIKNRSAISGKPYGAVITEPNAFEGYNDDKYKSLKAGSPQYQAVLNEVMSVLQGGDNPAGSADSYYSPAGMKAKGKGAPDWSVGKQPVANIGGNVFYSGVYRPTAPTADGDVEQELFGNGSPTHLSPPNSPVAASALPAAEVRPKPLKESEDFAGYDMKGQPVFRPGGDGPATDPDLPKAPNGYYWPAGTELGADGKPHIFTAGVYDPNQKERFNPEALANELERDRLAMTPGGRAAMAGAAYQPSKAEQTGQAANTVNSLTGGALPAFAGLSGYVLQGGQNIINQLTGQPVTVSAADAGAAERLGANEVLANEKAAHPGRYALTQIGGSALSAIPMIETGTGAIRAIPNAARMIGAGEGTVGALTPVSNFLTGEAGTGSGIGNFALRTVSKGVSGGVQGGLGGALTSGLTDRSVGENFATGALTGGALGSGGSLAYDALRGGIGVARSIADPLTESGRDRIVGSVLRKFSGDGPTALDTTEYVPGVQPTFAQATGNRGLATLETAFQSGSPESENAFSVRARANNAAREAYVDAIRGNKSDIEALQAARDADAGETLRSSFSDAKPADATSAIRVIDQQLAGPEGQVAEARSALTAARKRLVGTAEGLPPDQSQAFEQAALKSIGAPESKLDGVTMANAKARIGQGLDEVAARTNVNLNDDVMSRLGDIAKEWTDAGYDAKPINSLIQKIAEDRDASGNINGDVYQTLTRKGGAFDKLAGYGTGGYQKASAEMRDVFDQALEDSSSPQDLAQVRQLRSQYRNMKMIEQGMMKSPLGDTLTPQALLSSIKSNTSNFVYKGGDDLGDAAALAYKQSQPREQLESDPAKLFGVRSDLDKVARAGGPGAASAARARDTIDAALQNAAPGYRDYLAKDASYAQQIAEKRYLQLQRLDNGKGNITEAKVRNLTQGIDTASLKPGEQPAASVSPATSEKIGNLLTDLSREESSQPNAKLGSNTVNKLASQHILAKLGVPLVSAAELVASHFHAPGIGPAIGGAMATGGAKALYASKDALVREQLQNALLNPELGASLLSAAAPRVNLNQIPVVGAAVRQLPTAAAVRRNLLLGGPQAAGQANGAP